MVTLTVTDYGYATDSHTEAVIVGTGNTAPIATFGGMMQLADLRIQRLGFVRSGGRCVDLPLEFRRWDGRCGRTREPHVRCPWHPGRHPDRHR